MTMTKTDMCIEAVARAEAAQADACVKHEAAQKDHADAHAAFAAAAADGGEALAEHAKREQAAVRVLVAAERVRAREDETAAARAALVAEQSAAQQTEQRAELERLRWVADEHATRAAVFEIADAVLVLDAHRAEEVARAAARIREQHAAVQAGSKLAKRLGVPFEPGSAIPSALFDLKLRWKKLQERLPGLDEGQCSQAKADMAESCRGAYPNVYAPGHVYPELDSETTIRRVLDGTFVAYAKVITEKFDADHRRKMLEHVERETAERNRAADERTVQREKLLADQEAQKIKRAHRAIEAGLVGSPGARI